MSVHARVEEIGVDAMERFLDAFMSRIVCADQDGGHTWGHGSDEDVTAYGHQVIDENPLAGVGALQHLLK
jgi:hypothetical protein